MEKMKELFEGRFWTRESEMIKDLENENYDVLGVFYESIDVIDTTESYKGEFEVQLIRAGSTIAMKF